MTKPQLLLRELLFNCEAEISHLKSIQTACSDETLAGKAMKLIIEGRQNQCDKMYDMIKDTAKQMKIEL